MRTILLILAAATAAAAQTVSYSKAVRPLLNERCQACHNARNRNGGFDVSSSTSVPGSILLQVISGDKPRMPKAGPPLTAAQIDLIRRWVEQGAPVDTPTANDEIWWSRKPLVRPSLPSATSNPIDGFLEARLTAAGLRPSPEADRRTLIRRLTLDLHGLLPSPEETETFESDRSSGAYERLVDRLLASPRYGERWARHWLDVVHYGDSHGYDKDKPRPNAWPYRDWTIRALNDDMGYRRFVSLQLAGDAIEPDNPDAVIATGFIAAGPWDFVGHQELQENTTDKNLTRVLDRDDMVAATMSTFTSSTVHCARCHDHKFDPISQEDYYSVQAVFAGVDRADRPLDRDPQVFHQRKQLLLNKRAVQIELQPLLDKVDTATSPEIERLSIAISDAGLLIAHIGEPKTPAEALEKKQYQERAARDRQRRKELVDAQVGAATLAEIARLTERGAAMDREIAALPKPELVYGAANYFPRAGNFRPSLEPRPIFVLNRGNVNAPGKPAHPGTIGARFDIPDTADESLRRAALARWIVDDANPFTWRSIVNRVWHYHFGAGIVDTPNDFGKMGSRPTHPELLDWLALWFRDEAKGSLKQLHRLMVSSRAYRQSSAFRQDGVKVDADNRLLWRMNRTRMDAETLRDSILQTAGKLDLTMGGPSVRMFWFKDDHSPVYDYLKFDPDSPGAYRRSIYRFLARSVPDPFMDRLDCPDASLLTPKRSVTITAIQALATLNNPFIIRMADHLAVRAGTVSEAYRLALGRKPTPAEQATFTPYVEKHGMANFCRLLLNSNEFLFAD